jgi:DNA-binding IclR family transcriptional regulator
MPDKSDNIRAIERAIGVLECLAAQRHSLGIGELEKRVKLSRPTLYRILGTLISRNYVRKDGEPPRYRLDVGAGRLADAWTNSLDIVQLATPVMEHLLDRYDETIALYLRKDNIRVCVAEIPSRQALSYSRGLGHSGSLARGASGLAVLAHVNADEAARIISQERDPARLRMLRRKIVEVRENGYAISSGDFIIGAHAIASPVFDRRGEVIGSLGLFGPSVRFPIKRIAECAKAVKHSAALLSSLLGYR